MSIKATLPSGMTELTVNGLHQWDYGQKLEIEAADLPSMLEVHFSCPGMGAAEVRVGSAAAGVTTVAIPDVCLEQSGPITAWVVELGESSGTTIKTITLPVIPRTRPQTSEGPEPGVVDRYNEALAAMGALLDEVEEGNIKPKYAELADKAKTADSATRAESADTATTADTATEADHATSADTATEADHATSADTAKTADEASLATHAINAESLVNLEKMDTDGPLDKGLYLIITQNVDNKNFYTHILAVPIKMSEMNCVASSAVTVTYNTTEDKLKVPSNYELYACYKIVHGML